MTKALITLWLLYIAAMLSCGDGEVSYFNPKDAGQIEGVWERNNGLPTVYYFSNGKAVFESFAVGQLVVHKEYTYHTSRDTIFFREYPDGQEGQWLVSFADLNTVGVVAPLDSLSLYFILKRM